MTMFDRGFRGQLTQFWHSTAGQLRVSWASHCDRPTQFRSVPFVRTGTRSLGRRHLRMRVVPWATRTAHLSSFVPL